MQSSVSPRLEVHLGDVTANSARLVERCAARSISVMGITKGLAGSPLLAQAMIDGGVSGLGDSGLANIDATRAGGVWASTTLIRTPSRSQIDQLAVSDLASYQSDIETLSLLSAACVVAGQRHAVMLMVELGDLRDGIMPDDVVAHARHVRDLEHLDLRGLGANFGCQSGTIPDDRSLNVLSELAATIEAELSIAVPVVSGGNSSNLDWLRLTADVGRVNELRLGEAIILGRNPSTRLPVAGLSTEAVVFVAEVLESKRKPRRPWGPTGYTAIGRAEPGASVESADQPGDENDLEWHTVLAAGHQDTDPSGLTPIDDVLLVGASSDHLIIRSRRRIAPGSEMRFLPDYGAMARAAIAPSVTMLAIP